MYVATVIDCCSKVLGYAMADHMRTRLVVEALEMAADRYDINRCCYFIPTQAPNLMSEEFDEAAAKRYDLKRSVGRTGVCYDNAQAETFNSAVKVERVNRTEYPQPGNTPVKT